MVKTALQTEPVSIPCVMINCFCMFSDYAPLTIEEWEELDEKRRRKLWMEEGFLKEGQEQEQEKEGELEEERTQEEEIEKKEEADGAQGQEECEGREGVREDV